jgi:hypothetical protein
LKRSFGFAVIGKVIKSLASRHLAAPSLGKVIVPLAARHLAAPLLKICGYEYEAGQE